MALARVFASKMVYFMQVSPLSHLTKVTNLGVIILIQLIEIIGKACVYVGWKGGGRGGGGVIRLPSGLDRAKQETVVC